MPDEKYQAVMSHLQNFIDANQNKLEDETDFYLEKTSKASAILCRLCISSFKNSDEFVSLICDAIYVKNLQYVRYYT